MQQVMLTSNQPLRVWEHIEIIVGEGADAGRYRSRIEDFINGGIAITSPEFIEGNTLLRNDMPIMVQVTRDDAVYEFYSVVKQRFSGRRRYLILTPPKHIRRVQRRRFVRIDLLERVSYARINPTMAWDDYEDRARWHDSTTIDMSGGGAFLRVDRDIQADDMLFLKFGFFSALDLPHLVVGQCRRVCKQKNDFLAGVELVVYEKLQSLFRPDEFKRLPAEVKKFDAHAQDRLVNYIFNKQIELRNKGLL